MAASACQRFRGGDPGRPARIASRFTSRAAIALAIGWHAGSTAILDTSPDRLLGHEPTRNPETRTPCQLTLRWGDCLDQSESARPIHRSGVTTRATVFVKS